MGISLYIAIGIIVIIIAYMVIQQILNKRAVKELDQNEFHQGLRKAQVVDVREKVDYDYGHTLTVLEIFQLLCLNKDSKV